MKLTLFGMLNVDEKAKSPTRPNKKVPFLLLAVTMLLLPKPNPINQERDECHPRIDLERDKGDDNPRMSAENSAQVKEKKEDDSCCKHLQILETPYSQMK